MKTSLQLMVVVSCLVWAVGCGGRGDGGPSDVDPARSDGPVIATLGDSIVAGSPRWDPDPSIRDSFDAATRDSQWQRWVDAGGSRLRNCGVWGERTDEIAQRYAACTDGASAIVIQGGINDIVQGRPVEQAERDLACIAERARADDLRIAFAEVLPWNNGDAGDARKIRELNRRIRALASRADVPVLPFHSVLAADDDPDRMPDDLTEDGDHPNVAGYRLLGVRAWRAPRLARRAFTNGCEEQAGGS